MDRVSLFDVSSVTILHICTYFMLQYTYLNFLCCERSLFRWEFFITLRHKFLAVGGLSDKPLPYRRKYSNSVMVDCVPSKWSCDMIV